MLRLAEVGRDDFVIDLGSGDGRVVIAAAAKFGARGVGVDLDPERIAEADYNASVAGVADRVEFQRQDLFKFDISRASVVTMYLLPSVNMKLRPRLLAELKPGTRIVSHDFELGDWKPDARSTVRKNVFLWIVPANVEGRWRVNLVLPSRPAQLRSRFQAEISGDRRIGALRQEGRQRVEPARSTATACNSRWSTTAARWTPICISTAASPPMRSRAWSCAASAPTRRRSRGGRRA